MSQLDDITLLVGCPVYERAWVLPTWFDALASWPVSSFLFIITASEGDQDFEIIASRSMHTNLSYKVASVTELDVASRDWSNPKRYEHMSNLRNALLEGVRELYVHEIEQGKQVFFFSLDSDVLVPPWSEARPLFEAIMGGEYQAVSPLVYLSRYDNISNAFYIKERKPHRRVAKYYDEAMPVDVCCAAVLMGPSIIADRDVMYSAHPSGEDFGWSASARAAGHKLALVPQVRCKHIMEPAMLFMKDERVGW